MIFILGSIAGALSVAAAPVEESPPVPAELRPAVDALGKGDLDRAQKLASEFIKANPRAAAGYEVVADVAMRQRKWPEAEQALSEAVKLDPRRSSSLLKLGLVKLERGDPKGAEDRFRETLKITPRAVVAHRSLALALVRQGKAGAAIQAAEQAAGLSGRKDADTSLLLGSLYFDAGRLTDSERALEDALAAKPDYQQAQVLLGLVKRR